MSEYFYNCSAPNVPLPNNTECDWDEMSGLLTFQIAYSKIHGYVSAAVCSFGVLSNILMIIVLTRKSVISPTNLLLTALAVSDITTMASYLIYTVYINIAKEKAHPCVSGGHSFGWIAFMLLHNAANITSHVAATMIIIALATFRYIVVYFPSLGPTWCSLARAKRTIFGIFITSIIVTLPNNVIYYIKENPPYGQGYYWFYRFEWVYYTALSDLNMYIYGAGIKILASVLITLLSGLLLIKLREVKKRHLRLKKKTQDNTVKEHKRTTTMLLVIVSSFVFTEFPQGVLNLAAAANTCVLNHFYMNIGDVMDTLVLLNSSLNFLLLCGMSSQFRKTFRHVLLEPCWSQLCSGGSTSNKFRYSTSTNQATCYRKDNATSITYANHDSQRFSLLKHQEIEQHYELHIISTTPQPSTWVSQQSIEDISDEQL